MRARGKKMTQKPFRLGITAEPVRPDLAGLAATLEHCAALHVDFVELSIYDMDLIVGGKLRRDQLARLKAVLAGCPLGWSAHGTLGINLFDEERILRHLAVLRAGLDAAAEIGARNYVLHAGILYGGAALEASSEALKRQRGHLAAAAEWAKQRGVVICVENLFSGYRGRDYTPTPTEIALEIKALNLPSIRATLDFSHAHQQATHRKLDMVSECAALAPYAEHLHIHDSFGLPDDIWMYSAGEKLAFGHGDLHLPVGWGDVPWETLMEKCRFPEGCWGAMELDLRYWHEREACTASTRQAFAALQHVS